MLNENNYRTYPIKLGNSQYRYFLQLFEDSTKYQTLVKIIKYNPDLNIWQTIFSGKVDYTDVQFYNQPWNVTNSNALVLYSPPQGSGGFCLMTFSGNKII